MESGVNTPKPVEQKENDPKSDILNNNQWIEQNINNIYSPQGNLYDGYQIT